MKTEKQLIEKYKSRIAVLQRKIKTFEARQMGGACISLTGEIQAKKLLRLFAKIIRRNYDKIVITDKEKKKIVKLEN